MDGWVGVLPVLRIFVDGWMGGCNARFKDYFAKNGQICRRSFIKVNHVILLFEKQNLTKFFYFVLFKTLKGGNEKDTLKGGKEKRYS